MKNLESFIKVLPDPDGARRFFEQFREKNPAAANRLGKNEGLLSDVLALAADSPLLSTTLLQNPEYLWWLNRHRAESKIRDKEELLESLARFSMTNSLLEPQVLLARFRRRELLRIFLHDIRRLTTIAEITEEISNLADAVLEFALRLARQELDNRYGTPLETDDKGRTKQAEFCIVSFGKLGSKELNYSSDIDLIFVYSEEGATSGQGTREAITNREYFVKLSELIVKLVGHQTGEGAAYRVDLRLRPHGRVGALALSLKDTIRYYQREARAWERQVLIRSRSSAGDAEIFKTFYAETENFVFSKVETIENALENVRLSKEKINLEHQTQKGFNVKLGRGGVREIEFIAQALQLAYGGRDAWLRSSHTLISLTRLADRELLTESELTELVNAYDFLRRLEHLLQMEHGLQTHLLPHETGKRSLIAKRMGFPNLTEFDRKLKFQTMNVSRIFTRVFLENKTTEVSRSTSEFDSAESQISDHKSQINEQSPKTEDPIYQPILSSLEKSEVESNLSEQTLKTLEKLSKISPHFAAILAANPALVNELPDPNNDLPEKNYAEILLSEVKNEPDFAHRIASLRRIWSRFLLEIVVSDVFEKISRREAKKFQTRLAEASLETAIFITRSELERRFSAESGEFPFAVLGLGKLGGRGMDYGSDLDLVLIYDDEKPLKNTSLTHAEFYGRAVGIFVTTLSAMTREGSLYRVDLRLRPDGKNGATSLGRTAFLDYLKNRSAIWEWLAYVKLRAVAGNMKLAEAVETGARRIIHQNAVQADLSEIKSETRRIRERLKEEKKTSGPHFGKSASRKSVDIKFGAGGMLDVYFAMRFLQLKDCIPDDAENRSTDFMLEKLYEKKSLSEEDFANFKNGYAFLSELDHNLRLTVGRSTLLPMANRPALRTITGRMKLDSLKNLLENLTLHRLNIRASFENILKD